MNILTIQGSPRKNGNTATLLKEYLKGVEENHSNITIKSINADEVDVSGCKGCDACMKDGADFCIIKDDMTGIYQDIIEADTIVLATPVYFFSVTTQLKAIMDRLYAFMPVVDKLFGKKIVLLVTYGAVSETEAGVQNIKNMLDSVSVITRFEFNDYYGVSSVPTAVSENPQALKSAYELGKNL